MSGNGGGRLFLPTGLPAMVVGLILGVEGCLQASLSVVLCLCLHLGWNALLFGCLFSGFSLFNGLLYLHVEVRRAL